MFDAFLWDFLLALTVAGTLVVLAAGAVTYALGAPPARSMSPGAVARHRSGRLHGAT